MLFFSFAFISYLIILYWIPNVLITYGEIGKTLSYIGLLALAAFLSIFTGLCGILVKKSLNNELTSIVIIPMLWISKDLIIEKILSGFPWCSAGYSQYQNIYFIQIAEIGGIHSITFLVILINILIYHLLTRKKIKYLLGLVIINLFIYGIGYLLFQTNKIETENIKFNQAGIIQSNTSYKQDNTHRNINKTITELLEKSKQLHQRGAEFVIWPEYTVPIYPLQNKFYQNKFLDFAGQNCPLLAGFTDFKSNREIYNSILLFKKNGWEKYDKYHLTPFGEYIPLRKFLFFIKKITNEIADFTPGKKIHNLNIANHSIATPICYEIIFPELVRKFIALKGELIITISNDSWFGDSSAPYQHLSMAVFRSIENRRYILRSTSTGISAVISDLGRIISQTKLNQEVEFLARYKYLIKKTFFSRFGYLFPYFCLFFSTFYFMMNLFIFKPSSNASL